MLFILPPMNAKTSNLQESSTICDWRTTGSFTVSQGTNIAEKSSNSISDECEEKQVLE